MLEHKNLENLSFVRKEHAGAAGLVDWVAIKTFPKISPKIFTPKKNLLKKSKKPRSKQAQQALLIGLPASAASPSRPVSQ